MYKFRILFILMLLLLPTFTFGASKVPLTREFPAIIDSVEALGMGNAYYGVSSNKFASFYNPAALKYVPRTTVDIIPLTLGVNQDTISNGSKGYDIITKNSGSLDDPKVISDLINAFLGKYITISPINFFPAFTKKNLSIGIFTGNEINLIAYNKVLPELAMRVKSDTGVAFSYATQFLDDESLSLGFTVKGLYRINFTKAYNAVELAGVFDTNSQQFRNFKNEITEEGMGFAILASVGITYDVPSFEIAALDYLNPRIGLSFNDFGYQNFGRLMEDIDPTLNLSIGISPQLTDFLRGDLFIEFHDIFVMAGEDKSFTKRFHVGAQLSFWDRLFIRAGLNQGYPTAGLGVDIKFLRLNYAFYGEELGAYGGQKADWRHAVELTFGF